MVLLKWRELVHVSAINTSGHVLVPVPSPHPKPIRLYMRYSSLTVVIFSLFTIKVKDNPNINTVAVSETALLAYC